MRKEFNDMMPLAAVGSFLLNFIGTVGFFPVRSSAFTA